jgi:hypothetical protein
VVRRLVRKRWVARKGFSSRLPIAATSTIQLVPIQASLMGSGACYARSVQVMSRPWLIS